VNGVANSLTFIFAYQLDGEVTRSTKNIKIIIPPLEVDLWSTYDDVLKNIQPTLLHTMKAY